MKSDCNNIELKQQRKTLRKNQTPLESLLWGHLRNKRFHGLKFYRQYSIGKYILDFYCPKKHIAIEVDGSQHIENIDYDNKRTKFLKTKGVHVVRVWNNEVNQNIEGVLEMLFQEIFEGDS